MTKIVNRLILGIDPGIKGGLALLRPDRSLRTFRMPADVKILDKIIRESGAATCALERVGAAPEAGTVSTFTFGRGYGTLIGMCVAHRIPIVDIEPTVWKNFFNLDAKKSKATALARAIFRGTKIPTEGECEAALIALFESLK